MTQYTRACASISGGVMFMPVQLESRFKTLTAKKSNDNGNKDQNKTEKPAS